MAERIRLGELLVDMGLVTREQLEAALARQSQDSRRLGEILVDEGAISESQVTQVLSQQLSVPWVSLQHIDFSRQLLNLVPTETAEKYGVVPIYVRRARNRQETLYVAMQDPTEDEALKEIERHTALPVRAMIAPPTDIRAAIRAYYLGLPPEEELDDEVEPMSLPMPPGRRAASGPPPAPSRGAAPSSQPPAAEPPPRQAPSAPAPPGVAESADAAQSGSGGSVAALSDAQDEGEVRDGGEVGKSTDADEVPPSGPLRARDTAMPRPSSADAPRMVTLTMLDGTEITLPAAETRSKRGPRSRGPSADLTARDLIEALRAQAAGADASEVLGEGVSWERMFTALLSLLLKKHLIHDWEFVHELRRE